MLFGRSCLCFHALLLIFLVKKCKETKSNYFEQGSDDTIMRKCAKPAENCSRIDISKYRFLSPPGGDSLSKVKIFKNCEYFVVLIRFFCKNVVVLIDKAIRAVSIHFENCSFSSFKKREKKTQFCSP